MPDLFPPPELGDLVAAAARRIRILANRDLEPLGVTWGQVRALRTLDRHDGPVRMSALADELMIARRSATSVIDDLVSRDLVCRFADPDDRRAVAVAPTDEGRRLLERITRRRRAAAESLTSDLSADELLTLRRLLARLVDQRGATPTTRS